MINEINFKIKMQSIYIYMLYLYGYITLIVVVKLWSSVGHLTGLSHSHIN